MPTQTLPLELILIIIDNLDETDKGTLAACSLACKALTGPSTVDYIVESTFSTEQSLRNSPEPLVPKIHSIRPEDTFEVY